MEFSLITRKNKKGHGVYSVAFEFILIACYLLIGSPPATAVVCQAALKMHFIIGSA